MSTEEALTAFGTFILVASVFSVIVFTLAKIAQFQRSRQARAAFSTPAELQEDRTQWSDDAFGVPAPPPLTSEQPPPAEGPLVVLEPPPQPPPPLPPPPLPVPPPPPAPPLPPVAVPPERPDPDPPEGELDPDLPEAGLDPPQGEPVPQVREREHWVLGLSPFLPTPRGGEPSASSIERRYWQNLAADNSSEWLGAENMTRLAEGKPPVRVNRRTGRSEVLQAPPLHEPGDEEADPTWPSQAEDPFAEAPK